MGSSSNSSYGCSRRPGRVVVLCVAQLRDDDTDALVARPPDHSIASYQCWQVCPQVAAEDLTTVLAFLSLDFDLHAEVGDDQAGLFRAEIAALEFFHRTRFTARCASGAFFLDLLDAPALPTVELAFGHCVGAQV